MRQWAFCADRRHGGEFGFASLRPLAKLVLLALILAIIFFALVVLGIVAPVRVGIWILDSHSGMN